MFEDIQPVIGEYQHEDVKCGRYDAKAADVASTIGDLVHAAMPNVFVEHIGSTAVPGCAGKGTVDMMIACPDGEMERVSALLNRLGFQPQTGPDPFPEDRPMLVGSYEHKKRTYMLHMHVIPASSPEVARTRQFRDWLTADPDLMAAYVSYKKKIIKKGVADSYEYCKEKSKFIDEVFECL